MIRSVTITNPQGESLKLELTNPESSGLAVDSITGLGPSKVNIGSTELATMDGSIFASARAQERNIVFNLIMLPIPSIESARQNTYKFFPIKKPITILVETDNRYVETVGYVESNEPDIFSKQESTQISIICPDPFFYEETVNEMGFVGVQSVFEFEFENNSLTEDLIEFGEIRLDTRADLNYEGDVDTGVLISIHAYDMASNITLYNTVTRESMHIDTDKIETITGKAFGQSDDILISTVKGNKYVKLLRDGAYTNIIAVIDKDSDWFQLTNGVNTFSFTAEEGEDKLLVTFTYRNAYGGV